MTADERMTLMLENFFFWHLVLDATILSYFLARWLTALARAVALRRGVLAQVDHRSSHTIPTPRLGGVGLVMGFGIASAILLALMHHFLNPPFGILPFRETRLLWIGAGWILIFFVGLLDDVLDLPPLVKLSLSILAVLIPVLGNDVLTSILSLYNEPKWIFYLCAGIAAFWLLFFINAYNFMDGMDGFAAGFAQYAALCFFVITLALNHHLVHVGVEFLLLPLLAAACWGFLHWNNPPAKVFMGDGGSLAIGYLLGFYVILSCGYQAIPPLSALTVLLPFIFDVVLTLIRRARRGENLLKAHREHLYQRLMKTGLSHAEVLRLTKKRFWLCGLAALAGALPPHPAARWAGFIFALAVMLQYWRLTLAREHEASAQAAENK